MNDYESVEREIKETATEISLARDGDIDDVLNVCRSLLDLIARLNSRECGE